MRIKQSNPRAMKNRRQNNKIILAKDRQPADKISFFGRKRRIEILDSIKEKGYLTVNCQGGIRYDRNLKRLIKEGLIVFSRENISYLPHINTTLVRLTERGRTLTIRGKK